MNVQIYALKQFANLRRRPVNHVQATHSFLTSTRTFATYSMQSTHFEHFTYNGWTSIDVVTLKIDILGIHMNYLFLTGVTGLVGRYVLRDLLALDVPVAVICRSSVAESAQSRIESVMERWERHRWAESAKARRA